MPLINMNLVRLKNTLEQVKGEVTARVDRARDDNNHPNSDLFALKNPDIKKSMGEWLAERTAEAIKCQTEIDDYLKADGALEEFDTLVEAGRERTKGVQLATVNVRRRVSDVLKSEDWDTFIEKKEKNFNHDSEINLKSLFSSTSNATDTVNVESVRTGEYDAVPRTRVTLLDIIPQLETDQQVVKYDRETKNLSAVQRIAQGGIYSESEFTIEEQLATVTKAGAFIQVSEELLADRAEMRARLDGNLTSQLMRRVQGDLIGGAITNTAEYTSGASGNNADIVGFLDIPNANINLVDGNANASSGEFDNPITVLEEAAELIYRNGEAEADAIVMNSQDWVKVSTLQATTGQFILRGALAPLSSGVARMINDLPVVLCNALPSGTVLVGAFADHCAIRDRQSVQVRIQESQGVPAQTIAADQATATVVLQQTQPTGRYNIYCDARFAFYVRRPLAFTRITDFAVPA